MSVFPPSSRLTLLPMPASIICATACRSRIGAMATSSRFCLSISSTTSITSWLPPEPQLSQWSISRIGPSCRLAPSARARATDCGLRNFGVDARVGHDHGGDAGVRRVRMGEAGQQRRRQHTAGFFHGARVGEYLARWPVLGRVAHDRGHQRQPAPGHHRPRLSAQRSCQYVARGEARLVHVDVRISLVAGDHRGVGNDVGR